MARLVRLAEADLQRRRPGEQSSVVASSVRRPPAKEVAARIAKFVHLYGRPPRRAPTGRRSSPSRPCSIGSRPLGCSTEPSTCVQRRCRQCRRRSDAALLQPRLRGRTPSRHPLRGRRRKRSPGTFEELDRCRTVQETPRRVRTRRRPPWSRGRTISRRSIAAAVRPHLVRDPLSRCRPDRPLAPRTLREIWRPPRASAAGGLHRGAGRDLRRHLRQPVRGLDPRPRRLRACAGLEPAGRVVLCITYNQPGSSGRPWTASSAGHGFPVRALGRRRPVERRDRGDHRGLRRPPSQPRSGAAI